jgi:hypothetical protein
MMNVRKDKFKEIKLMRSKNRYFYFVVIKEGIIKLNLIIFI